MEDQTAIKICGLSKKYSISEKKIGINLSDRLKEFFHYSNKEIKKDEEFYALKDINFEINKGDSVGIIGRNGAGKSTLLKILSEVVEPSEGYIEITGKIASVLEVGMGFHPELTGRENVFLSGTMLGLSKKDIGNKFDEIVAFSGVEKFIDIPVKHYSSGMYVRLAFSVVANIDADILLFDEVLSVGDTAFQKQCTNKICDLVNFKKTVILVSHNMNDILPLCNKAIYLKSGRIEFTGNPLSIVNKYFENIFDNPSLKDLDLISITNNERIYDAGDDINQSNDFITIKSIMVSPKGKPDNQQILVTDKILTTISFDKKSPEGIIGIGFTLNYMGNIFMAGSTDYSNQNCEIEKPGYYQVESTISECLLNEGYFMLDLFFSITNDSGQRDIFLRMPSVLTFKINKDPNLNNDIPEFSGPIRPMLEWVIANK